MSETKICTKCKLELPLTTEYFHRNSRTQDGFRSECKQCAKQYNKVRPNYYQINREAIRAKRKRPKTIVTEEMLQARRLNKLLKHSVYNKSEKGKLRNIISSEKRRAIKKSLQHTLTGDEWDKCIKHFEYSCAYCGEKTMLTQDHFIPVTSNGEYTINNIIPCCSRCNSSKNKSDFNKWYPKQKFYSKERKLKILRYLHYDKNKNQQLALIK